MCAWATSPSPGHIPFIPLLPPHISLSSPPPPLSLFLSHHQVSASASLLQPATPIFKGENWPLLAVGKSLLSDLAAGDTHTYPPTHPPTPLITTPSTPLITHTLNYPTHSRSTTIHTHTLLLPSRSVFPLLFLLSTLPLPFVPPTLPLYRRCRQ